MTSWSKKQFAKAKPRIRLKVREVPVEKIEKIKKVVDQEFKQEVEELDVDTHRTPGEDS